MTKVEKFVSMCNAKPFFCKTSWVVNYFSAVCLSCLPCHQLFITTNSNADVEGASSEMLDLLAA